MGFLIRLITIFATASYVAKMFKKLIAVDPTSESSSGSSSKAGSSSAGSASKSRPQSPYEILGIKRGASKSDIKEAYLRALKEYHPDKVSHLGEDIQKLAEVKTQKIQEAYNSLKA